MSRIVVALLADLMRMLIAFGLRAAYLVLVYGLRLACWSVRRYGWPRVAACATAAAASTWASHHVLTQLPQPVSWEAALAGTGALTLVLSTGVLWAGAAASRRLQLPPGRPRAMPVPTFGAAAGLAPAARLPAPAPEVHVPCVEAPPPGAALWQALVQPETLRLAWERVASRRGAAGPDGVTVEAIAADRARHLEALRADLEQAAYRPQAPRWAPIPKPAGGVRRLAVLAVRDRVVQQALHQVLLPLWDPQFAPCSYAYRPGRSTAHAAEAVAQALAAGRCWVVDADVRTFFDSIPHDHLLATLDRWLPDARVRWLVAMCLAAHAPTVGMGVAQGAGTSPLLANLYLHAFDEAMLSAGFALVRYADDFVVPCATEAQAQAALGSSGRLLEAMGLQLHPDKTRIVHRVAGFRFLGYAFDGTGYQPLPPTDVEGHEAAVENGADSTLVEPDPSGADGGAGSAPASPAGHGEVPPDVARYRALFVGRGDVFGRHWQRPDGLEGYVPVRRAPADDDLRAHLRGEVILGTYLLQPAGTTRSLVFDVDGPTLDAAGRESAQVVAARLCAEVRRRGVEPLLLDSGGKGRHVWVCFNGDVVAGTARRWARGILDTTRPWPDGVLVELFPKQDMLAPSALGALLRLPLGRHPHTGRAGALLDEVGRPVAVVQEALVAYRPAGPAALGLRALDTAHPAAAPAAPAEVAPLLEGCALLRALVDKAARLQHLRHSERLALLYTLGHAGDAGQVYLHQVIALCAGYRPEITESWLRRLDDDHRPMSCARLKEWLREYLPGVTCACPGGSHATPLAWLHPPRRGAPRRGATPPGPAQTTLPAAPTSAAAAEPSGGEHVPDGWQTVAADLFGESLPAPDVPDPACPDRGHDTAPRQRA